MNNQYFLLPLPIFLGFTLLLSFPITSAFDEPIHDLLRTYGLPPGILPSAVKSYDLDLATGMLEVHLDRPCLAKYDGFVFFNQTVRGNLSHGSLRGLMGLSQEELFLWLPVKEILVSDLSSGVLYFDIGVAHKQLSLSLFENPPVCSSEGDNRRLGHRQMIREGPAEAIGSLVEK